MEDPQLKFAIDELRNSIDRLYKRIGNWWRVLWLGMIQGAGAVVGATAVALLFAWTISFFSHVPFFGDIARGINAMVQETK